MAITTPAKLAAEMARTLVHELDLNLAAAEQPEARRAPAPGQPTQGRRTPTPRGRSGGGAQAWSARPERSEPGTGAQAQRAADTARLN
ncbi:MAG TPA: hypothetical protein VH084_18550 [Mycobacterium sp.]|jgi:hypothetical protein|nr:hypothetical protein [Mycobacterium sp.]